MLTREHTTSGCGLSAPAKSQLPRLDGVRVLVLFGGAELFGQERGNIEVFRNMTELGLKARFIISSKWGRCTIQPELDRLGFEWTTAPFGYHWTKYMLGRHFGYFLLNLYGVIATSWRVWREVRRWKPTHLYLMNWRFFTYAAPAILMLRLPLIYRSGDELPIHTVFHRLVARKLVQRVDQMVCNSKHILQRCAFAGMARERMRVIYNYPPARAGTPAPTLPTIPQQALIVTYVGQISQQKGILLLLEAVERIIKSGGNLVLWLVGGSLWDDGFVAHLKNSVVTAGLENRVSFFGYVHNVSTILSKSDIHVCPSLLMEALPNVVGEAKFAGKPSIVFPTGGLPELIEHKVDGYICNECSVEGLTEGIKYFAADAGRRKKAGAAARRSLEIKFGLERFRREWAVVFESRV